MSKIKIFVNGKEQELESEMSISEFLKKKNIRQEVVTVELNDNIIERNKYEDTKINEGDRIELVFFMGGGEING